MADLEELDDIERVGFFHSKPKCGGSYLLFQLSKHVLRVLGQVNCAQSFL